MPPTFFPTVEEIIRLHETLITRYGGSVGLRDAGLLSSAMHRPQSGYYESIFEQAACLLQSLALNHVFVDGNKRVAFGATDIFLRCNGFELEIDASRAEDFIIKMVIKDKAELKTIAEWLEKHSQPLK
jgi:death-on-curing protein